VARERRLDLAVERGDPLPRRPRFAGQLADDARGDALRGSATVCAWAAASARSASCST
jgi:hypothetical protein